MRDVLITFRHPELVWMSDRTLRRFMSRTAKKLRGIHEQDLLLLIQASDLTDGQRQSLKDRVRPLLAEADSFYVERISFRSPFEITIILSALAIWFLQNTLGQSVKEAWAQTKAHKHFVKLLLSARREAIVRDQLDLMFGEETGALERFSVSRLKVSGGGDDDLEVEVLLETPERIKEQLPSSPPITVETVLARSRARTAELARRPEDDQGEESK